LNSSKRQLAVPTGAFTAPRQPSKADLRIFTKETAATKTAAAPDARFRAETFPLALIAMAQVGQNLHRMPRPAFNVTMAQEKWNRRLIFSWNGDLWEVRALFCLLRFALATRQGGTNGLRRSNIPQA